MAGPLRGGLPRGANLNPDDYPTRQSVLGTWSRIEDYVRQVLSTLTGVCVVQRRRGYQVLRPGVSRPYAVSQDSTVLTRMRNFCGVGLPMAPPGDRSAMILPSTHGARPSLEAASLSSSSGMVNRFAAPLLRAQPVRSPVRRQSARAACPAFSPDVDADVCRWGDGLHSWSCSSEQAYLADVPVGCSQVHTELPILSEG